VFKNGSVHRSRSLCFTYVAVTVSPLAKVRVMRVMVRSIESRITRTLSCGFARASAWLRVMRGMFPAPAKSYAKNMRPVGANAIGNILRITRTCDYPQQRERLSMRVMVFLDRPHHPHSFG
jgi:hypothetical protein